MCSGRRFQRLLDRPTGGVVNMDDTPVAMSALAGQVPVIALQIEWHAKLCQSFNRERRILHDKFNRGAVIQPRACDHRILDMVGKIIARLQHGGNPTLRPSSCAIGNGTLGQHRNLARCRQLQRRRQPRRARPNDQYIRFHQAALVRRRKTSSRSASLVVTSTMPNPRPWITKSTSPAFMRSLL